MIHVGVMKKMVIKRRCLGLLPHRIQLQPQRLEVWCPAADHWPEQPRKGPLEGICCPECWRGLAAW